MGAVFDKLARLAAIAEIEMAKDLAKRAGLPIEEARSYVDEYNRALTEHLLTGCTVARFYGPGLAERIYGPEQK